MSIRKRKYLFKPTLGWCFAVEFACRSNGRYPALDFLKGLDIKDSKKLIARIEKFAKTGKLDNKEHFKKLKGESDVIEFKTWGKRIIGYFPNDRTGIVVLTNGFDKKKDKTNPNEVTRCNQIRKEYEG